MTDQSGSSERRPPVSSASINISETVARIDAAVALIGTAGTAFGIFLVQRPGLSDWAAGLTYLATICAAFAVISVFVGLLFAIPSRRSHFSIEAKARAGKIRLYRANPNLQAYADFTRTSVSLLLAAAVLLIPAVVLYTPDRQPSPSYSITQTIDNAATHPRGGAESSVNISISFPGLTPGDVIDITVSDNSQLLGFAIGGVGSNGVGNASLSVQNIPESEQITISVTAPGWSCHGQLKSGNKHLSCGWT